MRLLPVPRNLYAAANPDVVVFFNMVQKTLQRGDTARPAQQSAVHADAHHFRCVQAGRVAFGIQRVEAITQVDKKIIGLREALRR